MAILVTALAILYFLVMAPLAELYAEREATLENRRLLAPRLAAVADELPGLRSRLAELRASASATHFTLEGDSDAIASANLQSRIEELAASAGAVIGSSEGLPPQDRGGYRRIGIRFALNGNYGTLVRLLAALETAAPPLVLDNLHMLVLDNLHMLVLDNLHIHGGMARSAAPPSGRLDAALEVYGFRRTEPARAAQR